MSKTDIILAPIQSVPGKENSLNIIDSIQKGFEAGIITVVPAGNFGPIINSLSPLALIPNVISVAAADNNGTMIADFSSRGIPSNIHIRPFLSAPGIDRITESHSGVTQIIKKRNPKIKYLTKRQVYLQWNRIIPTKELKYLRENAYILSGTSMAAESAAQLIALLIQFLKENSLTYTPDFIKDVLEDICQPIPNYEAHETGVGFFNFLILKKYLNNICNGDFESDSSKNLWQKGLRFVKLSGRGVTIVRLDNTKNYDIDYTK